MGRVGPAAAALFLLAPAPAQAAFTGENGLIYFKCQNVLKPGLCVAPSSGSPVQLLLPDVTWGFDISPDGKKLVYANSEFHIFINDLEKPETPGQYIISFARDPSFRPGCESIVMTDLAGQQLQWSDSWGNLGGTGHIWQINVDGSGLERLTDGTSLWALAKWSPDGSRLALADRDGLALLTPGGAPERLWTDSPAPSGGDSQLPRIRSLSWAPDGSALVVGRREMEGSKAISVIDRIDVPSGARVELNRGEGTYSTSPAWSPDGRHIIFRKRTVGRRTGMLVDPFWAEVWLMNPQGGGLQLVGELYLFLHPVWAPQPNFNCGCLTLLDQSPPIFVDRLREGEAKAQAYVPAGQANSGQG